MTKPIQVKTYIKLISTVPEKFIDELFELYGEETIQTDFVINLDKVAHWLKCDKKQLLKTLRNTYKEDIDYVIWRDKPQVKYGNNRIKCLITPDCFKRLCMMSRSKNAEQVRTYFIEIESLLIKYRTQLIQGIRQDMANIQKQKQIRKSIDSKSGYTYIIKASHSPKEIYKLGHTKDLVKRLGAYQTGKSEDVEVLFVYKTSDHEAVENCVKALVGKHRLYARKEIYHLNLDMLKSIMAGCGKLSAKLEYRMRGPTKVGGHYYAVLDINPSPTTSQIQ